MNAMRKTQAYRPQETTILPPAQLPKRDSGFFDSRKGKRSLEEMVASLEGDPVKEAAYALERVYNIEKSIVNVLNAISGQARAIVYQRRPALKRYQ